MYPLSLDYRVNGKTAGKVCHCQYAAISKEGERRERATESERVSVRDSRKSHYSYCYYSEQGIDTSQTVNSND